MSSKSQQLLKLLKERFIKGEIGRDEYLELKQELEEEISRESDEIQPDSTTSQDTPPPEEKSLTPIAGTQERISESPLSPGMNIGPELPDGSGLRYHIIAELGSGGWGAVYRAHDKKFARDVAVKALFSLVAQDSRAIKRIRNEAVLGAKIDHPNIVRIFDFDHFENVKYIVMELVEGGDLTDVLAEAENERLELDTALELLKGVCEGLDHMHSQGIIHRDMKPQNLLWHPEQKRLKISDFGLAYTARQSIMLSGMATGNISGTSPYMAPEIWDAADPSQQGDFYALGIIAYEMLKGDPPFKGPGDDNYRYQHQKVFPPPIAGLPEHVNDALLKMLSKSPGDRFSSAMDFFQALSEPAFAACPICGKAEDVDRFTCEKCGKGNICLEHRTDDKYCPECAEKIAEEKRRKQAEEQKRKEEEERKRREEEERKRREEEERIRREKEEVHPKRIKGPLPNMEFVLIPAGSFMMGAPEDEADSNDLERPQHKATLKSFYMQTTPVTQEQWKAVMGDNPSSFKGADLPVEGVSWDMAKKFIEKLNKMHQSKEFRLPSEAEWEYACRAGTTTHYYSGNNESDLKRVGWYWDNSGEKTHQVGKLEPNAWGLYDMHGNVCESCEDRWHFSYSDTPYDGSAWMSGSFPSHILRGGSYGVNPGYCRSASRFYIGETNRRTDEGFRLVCSP